MHIMDLNMKFKANINSLISDIKKSVNIDDLIFTTVLFHRVKGIYLFSENNKTAIRLLEKQKGKNFLFLKECRDRNYKAFEYILNDNLDNLIHDLLNPKIDIKEYAKKLNENVPKSEIWFRNKFKNESIYNSLKVYYNKSFKKYIYDVYLPEYQILIEIDGSFHDREDQKLKDLKKDEFAKKCGLYCIRVKAYDDESYNNCINTIMDRINIINKKRSNKILKSNPTVILRKNNK